MLSYAILEGLFRYFIIPLWGWKFTLPIWALWAWMVVGQHFFLWRSVEYILYCLRFFLQNCPFSLWLERAAFVGNFCFFYVHCHFQVVGFLNFMSRVYEAKRISKEQTIVLFFWYQDPWLIWFLISAFQNLHIFVLCVIFRIFTCTGEKNREKCVYFILPEVEVEVFQSVWDFGFNGTLKVYNKYFFVISLFSLW